MSEALYRELQEYQAKQRREWIAKAAPSNFIYHSFFTALKMFVESGIVDFKHLNEEFAQELLWMTGCLRDALEREGESVDEALDQMEAALRRHITLSKR